MAVLKALLLEQSVRSAPKTAVQDKRTKLTYRELGRAAEEFSAGFDGWWQQATGLWPAPDDGPVRVMLCAGNSVRYVVALIGLLRSGVVPFLMDPALGAEEIRATLDDCHVDAFLSDRDPSGAVRGSNESDLGGMRICRVDGPGGDRPPLLADTEVCRFTSGSTGSPRCIEFSGLAVRNAADAWRTATDVASDDRVLCFAGLFNGLAFNTSLFPALFAGASLYLPSGMPTSGQVRRFLTEFRPTRLTGFPALYESLLRYPGSIPDLAGLRVALSSAAVLRPSTVTELKERFDVAVSNYYGIAETGPLTFDAKPSFERGLGAPLPGVEFQFGDDEAGMIRVRSSSMGSRYLNAPGVLESRLDDAGFYRTGDEGELVDGRLFLRGRSAGAINVAGRKIDGSEVRAVLLDCGATDAVIFAVSKRNGDPMLAAVVAGPESLTAKDMRAQCLERMAPYKVPEQFLFLRELPMTSLGKPRAGAARELFNRAYEYSTDAG